LTYLLSSPNSQLPKFLAASTAADSQSFAPVASNTATTTAQRTDATRQRKPANTATTVKLNDPLENSDDTVEFLSLPIEEQDNILDRNFDYYHSLRGWLEGIKDYPKLQDHQTRLEEIVTRFPDRILVQLSQLTATNTQLKEENNRLSLIDLTPRKCNHAPELERLQNSLLLKEKEASEHLKNYTNLKKTLKDLFHTLPNVENPKQLKEAIKGLQSNERHADELTGTLQAAILEWENVGLELLSSSDGRPPTALEAQQQAQAVVAAFRATKEELDKARAKMAPSGMIAGNLTPEDCMNIWNKLPSHFRANISAPQNYEELAIALSKISAPITPCQHPEEIATDLQAGNPALHPDDWEESRGLVRGLAAHRCPETSLFGISSDKSRLFKITDVPKFTSSREYDTFRSKLDRFLRTTASPLPIDFPRALEIILSSFEDEAIAQATLTWDVSKVVQNSWKETCEEFLKALDKKFLPADHLERTEKEWSRTYPKKDETLPEFFNRFDGVTNKYVNAVKRSDVPAVTGTAVVAQLVKVLPPYLVDHVRLQLRMTEGGNIKNLTIDELRDRIEYASTYLPKPAAAIHATNTKYATGSTRAAPATTDRNEVRTMNCGMVCSFNTSPPVPSEARGSIYPDLKNPANNAANAQRRAYVAKYNLCVNCRRTEQEHSTVAARFRPVPKENASTRRTPQQWSPPTPSASPLPESRQIEAPPLSAPA
jgi:hypothetical protein